VTVVNDVTAAGYRFVDAGWSDFCIVTVGSGIGHKVFVDGRPIVGPAGRGGEIGHLQVDPSPEAPVCDCGGRGHLGGLASGRGTLAALQRRALRDPDGFARSRVGRSATAAGPLTTVELVDAFLADDDFVGAVVAEAAGQLGMALAAAHLLVGVERFVLVGGFARALGPRYRLLVARAAAERSWDLGQDWEAMVTFGYDDDDSGLIGAGLAGRAAHRP
jgi:glucokinase